MTGYTDSFETWSSMPQLLAEDWPASDRPAAVAYFCTQRVDAEIDRPHPSRSRTPRARTRGGALHPS